jgi:glycosyltransferase involved in cell wall biosynthesis
MKNIIFGIKNYMITIGYCTRVSNETFKKHLIKTCGLDNKKIQIIEIVNTGDRSLTDCYNEILYKSNNDIIVFTHSDLEIKTTNWGDKLLKNFRKNPEYGILGVAGSKEMPVSGMWWENSRTMYGQVYHTHEGKTWLSKYSDNINNQIQETVILDGVFFSINRSKIKVGFNTIFDGFHFYDIDFSFNNHINGVKVGVHFNIDINHHSIGQTNEKWEKNRVKFTELYKDNLPKKIKKVLLPNQKLKVLIGCLNFNSYTGSELYFYELAKQLIKNNCDVTICSNLIGGDLAKKAKSFGIKTYNLSEPPGYKRGDGKWLLNTSNGPTPSVNGTLYAISKVDFDVLHLSHKPITEYIMRLYPEIPVISTIHSEVIELENPVIDKRIKRYIAIRPEIKDFLNEKFDIPYDMIDIIYNPIDNTRFKPIPKKKSEKKRILFVGTMDYLREKTIKDLIERTKIWDAELILVGKNNGINLDQILAGQEHVKYFQPTWNIEKYIQDCDETAGILLGRTTIESWLCGKPAIIYNIDNEGNIIDKKLHRVPDDLDKFKSDNIVIKIIDLYKDLLE